MQITSGRLSVHVAKPGSVYAGPRFDWTGLVTQVTLDGSHTFCTTESAAGDDTAGSTGGIGLCNEFGLQTPIGFTECKVGQQFPKLGVGRLTRIDRRRYKMNYPYPIDPFPIRTSRGKNWAKFVVDPMDCRGYASRLTKTVRLADTTLTISYLLENVGKKPLQTDEYNHNFLALNNTPTGPDLELTFGMPVRAKRPAPGFRCKDKQFWWPKPFKDTAFWTPLLGVTRAQQVDSWWELRQRRTGQAMREHVSSAWCKSAVWGTPRVVSPEAFVKVDLAPGNAQGWTRTYTFEAPHS